MGVAIRALSGVERDYNAHTVRMRYFDHSGNITHIAAPQKVSQTSTSSRVIVGCQMTLGHKQNGMRPAYCCRQ